LTKPARVAVAALAAAALLGGAEGFAPLGKYSALERRHWSFQPRKNPEVPTFTAPADRAWASSAIDAFILARLKKEGLRPAPRADRVTLIRRVTVDLTGLPPTPAEVDAFVRDTKPGAWERLVDRLLDDSRFGEQWGRHWLDVVRFAETDGFEYDTHRRDAWRYRDYVIHSFNADKPYDQFVREQLAGDEINPKHEEYRVASGFQRLGPLRKNAGNQEVASSRNEVLTEMTNVVGSALLGVTLGCARCHDHKFDPIRHSDYYRIQAYFAGTEEQDIPLATDAEQTVWKAKTKAVEEEVKALRAKMRGMKGEERTAMEKRIKETEAKMPEPLPALFSVKSDESKASPVHLLARGDYAKKGDRVGMRPLGVLLPDNTPELPPATAQPRTKLADWLMSADNPLPARVLANRIWQYHFGQGIVTTPNDFGRMGARPSHPELLDYLGNEIVSGGWKMKRVHKMLLMSNAYQQASNVAASTIAREKDPENKLLWRFNRRRLAAEEIRDGALAAAGLLNAKQGGPSILVPVEEDLLQLLYKPSQWAVTPDATEHNRRTVYLIYKRNFRLPFMEVFDAPDLQISCAKRDASTHAPQALELLNGDFSNRMAEAFAERLRKEGGASPGQTVRLAYRLAAGRAPNLKEERTGIEFLKNQPLREFALAMLNTNAFLYLN